MAIQRSTLVTKAQELMNTEGLDYATAAKRAKEAMTTTTPVQQAPVTPAPVVPTPAPVTPTPIVNAPVDQTTGLSKPLEPVAQPVQPTPVTPTPVQPVSTTKVDTTPGITQDAFQQAKAESEKIKAQNDAVMAQNQQKAELARQDEAMKAEALIPKDEKGVLNALISGASVPKQNTQAYRNAEFKANNFRKFNSMTPTQLLDNLKQGQISSEMDQLLSQNPNYTQAKQKLNEQQKITNLNKTMNNIVNGVKGKEVATTTPEQDEEDISIKLMQKYGLDDANAQAFSQFVATDDEMADNKAKLLANRNQLSSVNRQIADATKLFNDGVSQLKKDYPNISASAIITLMGSRLGEFNDAITNLNSTKTLLQADIKDEMDLAKSAYDAKSADIQSQNAIRSQMALNEYKAEFDKQQTQEALKNPYEAIPAMIEEYKKLGVPFTRSTQQVIKDFESSGQDIATFLTELQGTIQSKPEYQAYIDKQSGTEWQSTSITRYNPSTGANESTPIFYRKKTSGGFEAVDLSGNPIDSSVLSGGGIGTGTPGTLPSSFTGDTTSYIASKEGFRDTAYQDSAGVWTIGYGTTKINGKPIQPGQKITQAEAQKQLDQDIAKHSNWKNFIDEKTLSDSQKTALASFEYNLGPGIWNKSAMNIIDMIKSGDLSGAGKEMQKYNQAGGKVIKGLQNRRAEEAQLLQSTGTSTTPIVQSNPLQVKEFEAYNGTTIPAQYKTPLEQDDFVKRYNEWRASRPGTKIEKGDDILNIRLDKGGTEGEKVSQSYTSRMLNAVNNLIPLEQKYADLTLAEQLKQQYLPTVLKSDEQKLIDLNKKNFITAVLRKQSGASIAPSEFAGEEMKYFPQPGDSKEVIVAKQNARNAEIKAMLATAGTDTEGNSISKYYNPPVIVAESTGEETIEDRLKRLRNKK